MLYVCCIFHDLICTPKGDKWSYLDISTGLGWAELSWWCGDGFGGKPSSWAPGQECRAGQSMRDRRAWGHRGIANVKRSGRGFDSRLKRRIVLPRRQGIRRGHNRCVWYGIVAAAAARSSINRSHSGSCPSLCFFHISTAVVPRWWMRSWARASVAIKWIFVELSYIKWRSVVEIRNRGMAILWRWASERVRVSGSHLKWSGWIWSLSRCRLVEEQMRIKWREGWLLFRDNVDGGLWLWYWTRDWIGESLAFEVMWAVWSEGDDVFCIDFSLVWPRCVECWWELEGGVVKWRSGFGGAENWVAMSLFCLAIGSESYVGSRSCGGRSWTLSLWLFIEWLLFVLFCFTSVFREFRSNLLESVAFPSILSQEFLYLSICRAPVSESVLSSVQTSCIRARWRLNQPS